MTYSYRKGAVFVFAAAMTAILLYLYFVPSMGLSAHFQKLENINNYPDANKVYFADSAVIHAEVFNLSLGDRDGLVLEIMGAVSPDNEAGVNSGFVQDVHGTNIYGVNTFRVQIGKMRPLEQKKFSFALNSHSSGTVFVSVLQGSEPIKFVELKIEGRPVPDTPQVPADIFSYLSDKAMEECQKIFPCMKADEAGKCLLYPDSAESEACVAEQNAILFSGCDEFKQGDLGKDWAICLMKKYGFN